MGILDVSVTDGELRISFTDTGRRTECIMGGDVCTVYVIPAEELAAVRAALGIGEAGDLPAAVAERFTSFLAIRAWLEAHAIAFQTVRPFFAE